MVRTLILTLIFISAAPHTCLSQLRRATAQEDLWLQQLDELISVIPGDLEEEKFNRYEALLQAAILESSLVSRTVEDLLARLEAVDSLPSPKNGRSGIARRDLQTAIVERLVDQADSGADRIIAFIQDSAEHPESPEPWHHATLTALRLKKTEVAEELMQSFRQLPESEHLEGETKKRVERSVELERAIILAQSNQVELAEPIFKQLLNADGVRLHSYSPFGGELFPVNRGERVVLENMIRFGLQEQAMEFIRQKQNGDRAFKAVPHNIRKVLLEAGHLDLARQFSELNESDHQRAYAFCEMARFNAKSDLQIEAELDLERGLEILKTTSTTSGPLRLIISETQTLLGHDQAARETRASATEAAVNDEHEHLLCHLIEWQMQLDSKPDWELLLPRKKSTEVISAFVKVAGWFHRQGDDETAIRVAGIVDQVASDYSAGAMIGSADMRVVRSDIWAKVMAARAWANAADFKRSLEVVGSLDVGFRHNATRLVARARSNESDETLDAWFRSINQPDLRAFAIIGVLERRVIPQQPK